MEELDPRGSEGMRDVRGVTGHAGNGTHGHHPAPLAARAEVLTARGLVIGLATTGPRHTLVSWLALAQGGLLLAGAWPLIDLHSFEWFAGPQGDPWMTRLLGMLGVVIGAVLLMARARRRLGHEMTLLGLGSALAFAGVLLVRVRDVPPTWPAWAGAAVGVALVFAWSIAGARDLFESRAQARWAHEKRMARWN
jgi:hypothetical protein